MNLVQRFKEDSVIYRNLSNKHDLTESRINALYNEFLTWLEKNKLDNALVKKNLGMNYPYQYYVNHPFMK